MSIQESVEKEKGRNLARVTLREIFCFRSLERHFMSGMITGNAVSDGERKDAEELQGHLFYGAFVFLAIIGVVFLLAYVLFLRAFPALMWGALAILAVVLLVAGWRFFRNNGALITGMLLGARR